MKRSDDDGCLERAISVQHDFGIRCRLTDGAGGDDLAAKRQPIGEIAIVRDGNAADFKLGEKRLHIAQRHLARVE